ncbi:MAG: hypothetical protein QM763_06890 [Agriterribacter sp.]
MEEQEFIRLAERIADGTATDEDIALYKRYCTAFAQKEPGWNAELENKEAIGKELRKKIVSTLFGRPGNILYRLHPVARLAASIVLMMDALVLARGKATCGLRPKGSR